jgi:protoheme IX farnesyltransferase
VADYWALTKPEVNLLIGIATGAGFYLALGRLHDFPLLRLFNTLCGTLLVASGTGSLNQFVERRFDAQMRRTNRRPLAAGRLEPLQVLCFGIGLAVLGSIYLAIATNLLTSLLAVLTLLSYLFIYTPLKRHTPLCTLFGAFPGAMPPLIGWAAASGRLSTGAWMLYAILFLWQFPHFMAIAWMYRDDYDRAGYFVLPQGKARTGFVNLQILLPLVALFLVNLRLAVYGISSLVYCIGSLLVSFGFFYYGLCFVLRRSRSAARRLLLASIVYLPLLLMLMVIFKFKFL